MTATTCFTRFALAAACAVALAVGTVAAASPQGFDHTYYAYAKLLARHLRDGRVDYQRLVADRAALVEVTSAFGAVDGAAERARTRYDWDAVASAYERLFERLVKERASRRRRGRQA
jgi:glycosyltransferase involved in cell wall biosynthesis